MSSSFQPNILLFKQDGATAIPKGSAVKVGADKKHVALSTSASDKIIGISQSASVNAEDQIEVAVSGGGGKALLGAGGCAVGDFLTATTAGVLIVTTNNADHYIAQAMEDGVSGDIVGVSVVPGII